MKRGRLRRSSSLEVLDCLLELRRLLSDGGDAVAHFIHSLHWRSRYKVWIAELRFELRGFRLQLLLFALQATALLFEVNQTFERHRQFRTPTQHRASRSLWCFKSLGNGNFRSAHET